MDDYTLATPDDNRYEIDLWTAISFVKRDKRHEFRVPEWQRNIRWSNADEEQYIETLIRYRESADFSIHVRRDTEGEFVYEILDGMNRLVAIKKFFANSMSICTRNIVAEDVPSTHRVLFCSLTPPQRETIKHIRLLVRIYDENTPEEHLKQIFLTRNMGKPITSGEMIHSMNDHPLIHYLLTPLDQRFQKDSLKLASGSCWRTANHGMYHIWIMISAMVLSDNLLLPYKSQPIREWLLRQYNADAPSPENIDRVNTITEYTIEALLDWGMHGKIPGGKKVIPDVAWVFMAYGCTLSVLTAVKEALEEIMQDKEHWMAKKDRIVDQIGRREILGGFVYRHLKLPSPITTYGTPSNTALKRQMPCTIVNTSLTTAYAEEEAIEYLKEIGLQADSDDIVLPKIDANMFVRICEYATVDGKEADRLDERKRKRTDE